MSHGIAKGAPILSVVLNWNGAKMLYDTLRDLSKQNVSPHRILVIDNASSDGSVDSLRVDFPEIELVRLPENVGFSRGNNALLFWNGWNEIDWKNGWIFFSNNDVLYEPDTLERLRKVGEDNEDAVSVSSWIAYENPRDQLWFGGGSLYPNIGIMGHKWFMKYYAGKEDNGVETTDYATACSVLLPARYFFEVGGFDLRFPHYGEDADLSLRLKKHYQGNCLLLRKTLAFHRVSSSIGSANKYHRITAAQVMLLRTHFQTGVLGYAGVLFYGCAKAIRKKGFAGVVAAWQGWREGMISKDSTIKWERPQ